MKKALEKTQTQTETKSVVVFQGENGGIELRSDQATNIWATQAEMSLIFDIGTQAITKHIKNIYLDKELAKASTCSKMEQVRIEGGREVKRNLETYNLDVIIAVGYRINSVKGTKFRQWATKTLKSYIVDGFAIQKNIIKNNLDMFLKEIKPLLPAGSILTSQQVLEVASIFSSTWLSLDQHYKIEK